jgi:hypothetical protein
MSNRHRSRILVGWGRIRVPLTVVVTAVLVVAAAVTVEIVSADASGCRGTVSVRIAAAPEIAPALGRMGADWMATRPEIDGGCVELIVTAVRPADEALRLSASAGAPIDVGASVSTTNSPGFTSASPPASSGGSVDVWVPDSSAWLDRVEAVDQSAFAPEPRSIASTPVLLAMPSAVAHMFGWPARPVPMGDLLADVFTSAAGGSAAPNPVRLGLVDPRTDASSLAMELALTGSVAATDDQLPALVAALRAVVVGGDTATLLDHLDTLGGSAGANVVAVSEQSANSYLAARPGSNIVAATVEPPMADLDYPYAVRTGVSQAEADAAHAFRTRILAVGAAAAFERAGFRAVDTVTGPGLPGTATSTGQEGFPIEDPVGVARALTLWAAARTSVRTLALVDLTASMGTRVGRTQTRAGVMDTAAKQSLALFTPDSAVGVWSFGGSAAPGHPAATRGTQSAPAYQEVAPITPLDQAWRGALAQRLDTLKPGVGTQTNLYAALLAAYQYMVATYDPQRLDVLIVFTDNADYQSGAAAREAFTQSIQQLANPSRPVRIVLVGIGTTDLVDANLRGVAQEVGGSYFPLVDPTQIQSIFLKALLQLGA